MVELSDTATPRPGGSYSPWTPPGEMDTFQEALALGAYPPGSRIVAERSYRPGYMRYPLRLTVSLPDGSEGVCVLKIDPGIGNVEKEARLLPVLARLGLPVPRVLAGPVTHPAYPDAGPMVVLSKTQLCLEGLHPDSANQTLNLVASKHSNYMNTLRSIAEVGEESVFICVLFAVLLVEMLKI